MQSLPEDIFRSHGGQLRMSEAIACGISRYMLYSMYEKGTIEKVSRGIYRLADLPPIKNPDLVSVSLRFPRAVLCLVSALAYHDITTQIPHRISIAVPRKSRLPALEYPPITSYRFSDLAYSSGIINHEIDGVSVKIYCPEKTIVDCFKYRNKVGMDIVLEALRLYRTRKTVQVDRLIKYADICRVQRVMRPYLEATL